MLRHQSFHHISYWHSQVFSISRACNDGLGFGITRSEQLHLSLKSFGKPFRNQHLSIEKSFHTVYDACFCLAIEFAAGFFHTLIPAHIGERSDLRIKLEQLFLSYQLLLELLIDLGVTGWSSKRHFEPSRLLHVWKTKWPTMWTR